MKIGDEDDLNTPKKQFENTFKSGILKNSSPLGSAKKNANIISPLKADSNSNNSAIYV